MIWRNKILECIELSKTSNIKGVPVGCILTHNNIEIAKLSNGEFLDHCEFVIAKQFKHLKGYTLYVNLEPCLMCYIALSKAHLSTIVFGAPQDFPTHEAVKVLKHLNYFIPEIYGYIENEKCKNELEIFFKTLR